MGLKIFTIILALFIAELTFLATKEPKDLSQKEKDFTTADLSFSDLKGATITPFGISSKLEAKKVVQFKNKQKLYKIKASHKEANLTHTIKADMAIGEDGLISFKDNVFYQNSQNLQILTQFLEYNTIKKKITAPSAFSMSRGDAKLDGKSLLYDLVSKNISVVKPHFTQEVDE